MDISILHIHFDAMKPQLREPESNDQYERRKEALLMRWVNEPFKMGCSSLSIYSPPWSLGGFVLVFRQFRSLGSWIAGDLNISKNTLSFPILSSLPLLLILFLILP